VTADGFAFANPTRHKSNNNGEARLGALWAAEQGKIRRILTVEAIFVVGFTLI